MFRKFIPYSHQWIDKSDIGEVVKVLKSDWITQGPKIAEFEKSLAKFVGAKYAVVVSSGTAALHAACAVSGIREGDEVIVPTLSFVASANCVLYCGARPILVDVYDDTLTINAEEVEKKINKKTKALIAVDFAGQPASWDKLKSLARSHNLTLIDDAAHALGSKYKDQPIGSIADLTIFSFHPVKTITTGEGGAITTNSRQFYEKLLLFRNHGMVKTRPFSKKYDGWYYDIQTLGYNLRMTDLQAALGLSQLKKIGKFIKRRRAIWQKYGKKLGKIKGLVLPYEKRGNFCAWHLYPVRFRKEILGKSRREIFEKLRGAGVGVQIHYIPIHRHSLYRKRFGYANGDFPVAEKYYKEAISLPLFAGMTNEEFTYINSQIKRVVIREK